MPVPYRNGTLSDGILRVMQSFRGPIVFDEIEAAIGPADEAIIAADARANTGADGVLGYAWKCGCEARGNVTPFCLWASCSTHRTLAADLGERTVPAHYRGGVRVPASSLPAADPGAVFVPAGSAIAAVFAAGATVCFIENGEIVREYPNGRREVVSSL
jgi:hypothetical protein